MMHNNDRYRDLKLFLALALAGIVAALNHVHIPYTQVLIDGRWAFGFIGFALLRRWWAALALAALLSYPYGMPDIPLWIGFGGNMLYAVPALLTLRPLLRWMLRRWGTGWRSGLGWLALVLLCYQAFTTPVVWGVSALLEKRPAMAGILEGWRAQPFLVESLLVALFSTAALVAALAVAQLREHQRRLEHINRVLLGIRNVNQLIVKEDDPHRLIERACVNLTETMGYHNAWIALLGGAAARALGLPETEPVAAAAAAGFDGGFARLRARLDRGTFPDCMRRALESGDALVVDDPAADCPDCPLHGEYGGRAGLTRQLDFDGVVYGILTTSVPGDYAQDAEEQDLFKEVAGDLAFALHKIVTARRLAESRQHLSFVIEGSGVGTWAWNIQTNATVFSAQWATMLGYTIEELTPYDYVTWERMVHPADLERARAALAACVAGGTADYSCEFRMKHKDGRWVWILDRGRVMTRDEEGKPLAMFGTHTDITEMKQAEASLKRERAMLARTEAVAHVGSWEWEAAGDKVAWSEELFHIFGLEPAEQAPPFAEHQAFYVPEDRARLLQAVEACLRDGVPYDLEVRVTRSDGEVRHCVARGLPEREADGAVKRLYGSLQDITEIRRAEGRIALLGRMLDDAPACISIHDTDGRFVFANAENVALHGYDSLDEFLQVNLHELDVPESEALLAERFKKIAEEGEARFEVEHYRKDGSTFPLEVLAKQITWEGRPAILSIAADITERKRAEESLLESERRFQRMLEVVPDMISIHSPDMDILYSNWQGFAAVPKDKRLPNTKCYRTYRGLDKICPDCRAGSVLETRKPFQQEVQLPDGTWVDLRAIPLLDQDHNVEMFMEWVRDITEHKQAEESLRRSEERFRRAIAEAPFPAMIHAEDGEVIMLNAEWTRVTGYQHDEIPTIAAWAEKAYGARQGTMRAAIAGTYAAEGHMDEGDFEIRCRDGATRIWTFRSTPLDADEQGRRLVLSMAVDITEQVYAREKRERLAAQVAAQARQLQAILDTVPQGVLLLNDAGRILHANRVAEKDLAVLAGVQAGDALTRLGDRPLVELLTSPPVKGLWHEVQAGGCTFEVIARPVEQGPAPERWVLVIKDATRERDVQAQLQHQERLAAVGQLAGGIAHDFNNIMAVIILYAGMVARADGLTEPEREKIAIINQQGWHATRLIQQILDFSRQAVLEQQSLDLLPLLKEHVKLLARTLPEHIDITLAHGEEACVVSADLTRVQQMLMNLALNARDAMRDGGSLRIGLDKIEVQPGASPLLPEMAAGEWVQLTVADTGTGIAPDVLPRIFDPFFTTKAPGEGSGLGLAQVEGIVGQHGGRIGVTTALGQGTTFTIYLPALTACPVEPPTPDVSSMPQGQGEVVLVVEDQAAVRAALVDVLEQLNYQALEAANGEQALAVMQARGAQVAVVVSDVVMPVMGGVRLLHALRQQGWETPVILLTGHVVGEDFDALRTQGLHAWLPKPPDLEQLMRAIAGALGK